MGCSAVRVTSIAQAGVKHGEDGEFGGLAQVRHEGTWLHGVHRATAARWVDAARETVLAGTQRELIRRLRISRSELASVIRLIQSQLELSLLRVLRRG